MNPAAAESLSQAPAPAPRLEAEPLPDNLRSVQPGGGVCYRIELAWGRLRRALLKRLRPAYVQRMAQLRHGSAEGCPHEILDPRDLKYCRNVAKCWWDAADDRFAWRGRLGFARWGLAELQLMGWPLLALTVMSGAVSLPLVIVPGVLLLLIIYFFRDPRRRVPQAPGLLVAPADGRIAEVTELDHHSFIGGPAVRIGIFLSIFNVHINRAPLRARVIRLVYSPGQFLNAMRDESRLRNENLLIGLEEEASPHRRIVVRQIAGLLARRIVCELRPGEVVERGHKFGMIKLGSRTELIVPREENLKILIRVGDVVHGGSTVVGRYLSAGDS